MANRRLQLQRELELLIGTGNWIGTDVEDLNGLAEFEIPSTANVDDFLYVINDSDHYGQRGIYKIVQNASSEKVFEYTTRPVYFQPPGKHTLEYPCVIYHLSDIDVKRADNVVYRALREYQLILVDENPDSEYVDVLLDAFQHIGMDRTYIADNLNHWVFSLYY